MDYNNSSWQFRPLGSRIMALSIKCDSLALRTESRKESIFSSRISACQCEGELRSVGKTLLGQDRVLHTCIPCTARELNRFE